MIKSLEQKYNTLPWRRYTENPHRVEDNEGGKEETKNMFQNYMIEIIVK